MRAACRLALEVQLAGGDGPAAAGRSELPALVALVSAAGRAGFDALWVAPVSQGHAAGGHRWSDQTVVAGALAALVRDLMIGVVASPAEGRHPAVLAREVTTVDLLSGGRAALLLHGQASTGVEAVLPASMAEAVTICHALFTEDRVTVPGATYRVEGAVNRPRPVRSGGPFLALQLPEEMEDVAAYARTPSDALVVAGGEEAVGSRRRALGALDAQAGRAVPTAPDGAGAPAPAADDRRPALLWRGPLPDVAVDAAHAAQALVAAGADGLVVQVGSGQLVQTEWLAALGQAVGSA